MFLEPAWAAVLGAIVDAPRAWSTAAELARMIEIDESSVVDTLGELQIHECVAPFGECWTLTPLSSDGLRVHLIDSAMSGRERWASIDAPAPRVHRASAVDPLDGVWRDRRREPARCDQLPKPTRLLMGCRSVWAESRKGLCPACQGRPLDAATYCLRCDRWGLDGVAGRLRKRERLAEKEREQASKDKKAG